MIKKITLALLLCCMVVSCGKKGKPEYKDPNREAKLETIFIKKV